MGLLRGTGAVAGGAACSSGGPLASYVCAQLGDRAVNRLLNPTNEAPSYFGAHFFHGAGEVVEGNQLYGTAEMGYAIVGGGISAGKWLWNQLF